MIYFSSTAFSQQWSTVGQPDFADSAINGRTLAGNIFIAIAPNGDPYVIYRTMMYGYSDSPGRVMKFNGSNWVLVGSPGFSTGDIGTPTMAFNNNGTPYIAYRDIADSSKATVMKFDGSNWVAVGKTGFTPGAASYTSIAIDSSGTPYVAFRDVSKAYRASVMKFNGSNWVYVGTPGYSLVGGAGGGASDNSLAIDANGILYVAYSDLNDNFKAYVMKFDGTNWVNVGTGVISAGSANSTSIVIDSYGIPYVGYTDGANGYRATVMKFDGSNWVPVGIPGFSPGIAENTSLAIDNNDKLYLSFKDYTHYKKGASVMTFNGSSWVYVGTPGFSDSTVLTTSIAIDKNKGILYTAYETVYNEYSIGDPNNPTTYNATVKKFTSDTLTTYFTQNFTICNGQSIAVGNNTYFASGTYKDTLTTTDGRASIVTTNLTVNPNYFITIDTTLITGQSITIGTHTYSASGTYQDTLIAANGCDSIVTTELSVISAVNSVLSQKTELDIYPNPTDNFIYLTYQNDEVVSSLQIMIKNVLGQNIYSKEFPSCKNLQECIDMGNKPKGVYFVEVIAGNKREVRRIVLE